MSKVLKSIIINKITLLVEKNSLLLKSHINVKKEKKLKRL